MFKVRDKVKAKPSDRMGHELTDMVFTIVDVGNYKQWGMPFKYRAQSIHDKGTLYFFNDEDIIMVEKCRIHRVGGNVD